MNQRNRSPLDEDGGVNIKPITTDRHAQSFYEKGAYLRPFANQRKSTGIDEQGFNEGDPLGL